MKYLLLISVFLIFGCSNYYLELQNEYRDYRYGEMAADHNLYYGDFSEIENLEDISAWIMGNVFYKVDIIESWDNPQEVLERGYGDCDDFSLLVMNIAYVRFGVKYDLVLIDTAEVRIIENGGSLNHATIAIGDIVYDVYNIDCILNVPIAFRYTFDYVFN